MTSFISQKSAAFGLVVLALAGCSAPTKIASKSLSRERAVFQSADAPSMPVETEPAPAPVNTPETQELAEVRKTPEVSETSEAPETLQPRERKIRFAGQFIIDHQPNEFATVIFTDGSKKSLGSAVVGFSVGACFPVTSNGQFEVQGLFGIRGSSVDASNGSLQYLEFPVLEFTGHVNLGTFRLGAGPSFHFNSKVWGTGAVEPLIRATTLDTAIGALGTIEYITSDRQFGLGLRGELLRMSVGNESMDASRIGIVAGVYL